MTEPTSPADSAGARIAGRYTVIRPLGRGSFGHTVLARDEETGGDVAVKMLHPQQVGDWKTYELFEREAAVLRSLRHPGIPAVHSAFRTDWNGGPTAFLVMEYVEGTSIQELIESHRHLEPEQVLHLFVELLGVLDYLHSRVPPVLHRDIKPANLIIRPGGAPALVDFGAVRTVFRAPNESGSTIVGTYGYMPYEQYMGQASAASDLYSLAATFLHFITGRPPPAFMTEAGRLEVPATLPTGPTLRAVLARMLEPAPADRFQSARDVRGALLTPMAGEAPRPRSTAVAGAPSAPVQVTLPPGPRPLTGTTAELFKKVAYSPWLLMNTGMRPAKRAGFSDYALVLFFSVITAGIMPAIFWSTYSARKRRLKEFFRDGIVGTAEIFEMTPVSIGFDEKLTRVRYQFEMDGRQIRSSDQVLPWIAERWRIGDMIQILYLPDRDYDSAIISTW